MPVLSVSRVGRRTLVVFAVLALAAVAGIHASARAQARHDFTVIADQFAFQVVGSNKPEIRVALGDDVRITFDARDIPHSFTTVDDPHYRIDRRAEPGRPVTFEFRADQAGTVKVRCTLAANSKCRQMQLNLIVERKGQ